MNVYNIAELKELMRSFYMFSGIRFVLFDTEYRQILSFPEGDCSYCRLLKRHPTAAEHCRTDDLDLFRRCAKSDRIITHTCHAGMVEAAVALRHEGTVTGYLMFGQIADKRRFTEVRNSLLSYGAQYVPDPLLLKTAVEQTVLKTDAEILAAGKIVEACTSYILLRELIFSENDHLLEQAKAYVEEHLEDSVSVQELCRHLKLGRTKLYEIFSAENGCGVAEYIRRRKMDRAKELIRTTDLSVTEISLRLGFSDYNYFGKVFRKTFGRSPASFRSGRKKGGNQRVSKEAIL